MTKAGLKDAEIKDYKVIDGDNKIKVDLEKKEVLDNKFLALEKTLYYSTFFTVFTHN